MLQLLGTFITAITLIATLTLGQIPDTVAIVANDPVPMLQFQQRVRLARWQIGQQLAQIVGQYGAKALTDPNSPYASQYNLLGNSKTLGQQVLDSLIIVKLIEHEAAAQGITVADTEIDAQINTTFGIAISPVTSLTPAPTETAALIANRDNYLGGAGVAAKMNQAELRAFYAEQVLQAKLYNVLTAKVPNQTEQIKVRHILTDTPDKAQALLARLRAGAAFADLVKTSSLDTTTSAQGGDLGWTPRGVYDPDFDAAIWQAKVGTVIGPIKTKFGYHLLFIEARAVRPLTDADFARAKNVVYQAWLADAHNRSNIQIISNWGDYVPADPTPVDLGLPAEPK